MDTVAEELSERRERRVWICRVEGRDLLPELAGERVRIAACRASMRAEGRMWFCEVVEEVEVCVVRSRSREGRLESCTRSNCASICLTWSRTKLMIMCYAASRACLRSCLMLLTDRSFSS